MFPILPEESNNLMKALIPKKVTKVLKHPSEQVPNVTCKFGSPKQVQLEMVPLSKVVQPAWQAE